MKDPLEQAASLLLSAIGEDMSRPGLERTPARFAKAMREITAGYSRTVAQVVGDGVFPSATSEPVIVARMKYYSLCEHHLMPFYGECSVAYIPNRRIIGLSKIPKLVDLFAQRLQVQEHLTSQIGQALDDAISPLGTACLITGTHLCSVMRNLKDYDAPMITTYRSGAYKNDNAMFESFQRIALRER
jgi:GTP cyclohydrolase I